MDLGPLLPGRIPNSLVADRLKSNLMAGQKALVQMQEQVATGQKYFLPSEDPASALRTIGLKKLLQRKDQMLANIASDQSLLGVTENTLQTISDALNTAKQLVTGGIGDSTTAAEKQGLAIEAGAVIRQLVNAGNTQFRGRYLFGGSQNDQPPFSLTGENAVRYEGDQFQINGYIDLGLQQANNLDGASAFGALSPPVTSDANPALTLKTRISDLYGGGGVSLGQISVSLSADPPTKTIDLANVQTVGDLKATIEAAFTPGAVTVSINAAKNGISVTPASGTVSISDLSGGFTAANLGIRSTATAGIVGGDLNPRLTKDTLISDLNGGTGIGVTAGKGLLIQNGATSRVIDLSSATTVEGLFNLLREPSLGLSAEINANGNGLAITSRLNGANFSIGENGGTNATALGIRTTTATTELSKLNYGQGVPVNNGQKLNITRRNGTVAQVDLNGSLTVQDVLTKINAVDPGNLVASLVANGNGISILDNSGTGALSIENNELSKALGLAGSEPGSNPAIPFNGSEPNWQEAPGSLNILVRLQDALNRGDNGELTRLNSLIEKELARVNQVRGEVGGRMKVLDNVDNRIRDASTESQKQLATEFEPDMAELLTRITQFQTTFEATLKVASQIMQLSLVNYL